MKYRSLSVVQETARLNINGLPATKKKKHPEENLK
jgi:hypothetical protein